MANSERALIHLFGFAMLSPRQENVAKSNLRQRHSILISNLAVGRQGRGKVLMGALQISEVEEDVPKIIVFVAQTHFVARLSIDVQRLFIFLTRSEVVCLSFEGYGLQSCRRCYTEPVIRGYVKLLRFTNGSLDLRLFSGVFKKPGLLAPRLGEKQGGSRRLRLFRGPGQRCFRPSHIPERSRCVVFGQIYPWVVSKGCRQCPQGVYGRQGILPFVRHEFGVRQSQPVIEVIRKEVEQSAINLDGLSPVPAGLAVTPFDKQSLRSRKAR